MNSRQRLIAPFTWTVIAIGAALCALSAARLNLASLDLRFALLAVVTLAYGARLSINIPAIKSEVTVSDTFIFLTLLLYGAEATTLLAAVEACSSSLRFSRKPSTILFNSSVMATSVFSAAAALRFCFGEIEALPLGPYSSRYLAALALLAFVHYIVNAGLASMLGALRTGRSVWATWRRSYFWAALAYFAGASAAGAIAKFVDLFGFYAILGMLPIVAIIYLTYRTYLRNLDAAAQQSEQARRHIEELSRYIEEQERMREQLTQMEKMSALGELASGVAHNFNNTLAAILGRAELMRTQVSDPKLGRGLDIIAQSARDGAHTVRRIQDFARQRRAQDFAPVAVDELLSDACEITRPRWKDRAEAVGTPINLTVRARTGALISGDASELRDVLVNIIFNAVDAMPVGGDITLAALAEGERVVISVSDTGTGMKQDVRARVFDPFFTTKGGAGMGLGLAVSYSIINRHEGVIEVESEPERGTTFRIALPLAGRVEAARAGDAAAAINQGSASRMKKILVVDDEAPVRELLREILEEVGCEVALACGGEEALALFAPESFDAVFTDIGMPGMNGWELARRLRALDPALPLAVITGWGDIVSAAQKDEARINWLLTKPFSLEQIMQIGGEIVERQKFPAAPLPDAANAGMKSGLVCV